ncbi:MAG: ATP-binding protein [Persephonella sp.]|nr:ATP-binding protein [Persephonella sp.]
MIDVPDNITISGDKKLLRQAFLNIIQNSFESTSDTEKGKLSIAVEEKGDYLEIYFVDNGKGIPPEELDKVFIPYYSKSPKAQDLVLQ